MSEHADPRPPWAMDGRAAALAAFDRRDDGAALAALTVQTPPVPEDSRAGGGTLLTTLRFDHDGLVLDLRVRADGPRRSLSGLVSGDFGFAAVDLRRPAATVRLRVGADGGFLAPDLARGPVSLALRRTGRPPVVTDWFTV
ncbi:hypothetical protein ACIBFB_16765 [Nocardiopsis sp. NPDC050513]|uniref:hypothetical protein n=1 Tax=Nocardiopsis sp. NPDC050513 TaxID=3364338 RepID=UPI0037B27660